MYLRDMSISNAPADLFFDLDRTLWDFDRNSREALEEIFLEIAQPNLPQHKTAAEFIPVYEAENEKCWKAYREGRITKEQLGPFVSARLEGLGIPAFDGMEALAEAMGTAYVQRAPYRTALFDGAVEASTQSPWAPCSSNRGFEGAHIKVSMTGSGRILMGFTRATLIQKTASQVFSKGLALADSQTDRAVMIGDDWEYDVDGTMQAGWGAVHFDPHQAPSLSTIHQHAASSSIGSINDNLERPLWR